jgi:hypothetical protein
VQVRQKGRIGASLGGVAGIVGEMSGERRFGEDDQEMGQSGGWDPPTGGDGARVWGEGARAGLRGLGRAKGGAGWASVAGWAARPVGEVRAWEVVGVAEAGRGHWAGTRAQTVGEGRGWAARWRWAADRPRKKGGKKQAGPPSRLDRGRS